MIKKITGTIKEPVQENVFSARLVRPIVYVGLALICIFIALIISSSSIVVSGLFVALSLGLPFAICCFVYPKFGFLLAVTATYFIIFLKRITYQYDAPFGVLVEMLLYISAIGALFRSVVRKELGFQAFKNPLAIVILIWLSYQILQAFNPQTHSLAGWFVTMRDTSTYMLFFFLALYMLQDLRSVRIFTLTWVGIALLAAVYGVYQEYAGLPEFDLRWVYSSEARFRLNFIWGRFRKWSFISDAANFGVLMAFSSIFCIVLLMGPYTWKRKIWLGIATILMCMAMGFSGTRTAYAMVPAGVLLYVLMTINNYKTLIFAFSFIVIFAFLIFGPIENPVLNRVRSAFDEDDPSLQVRNENRKAIQPYIIEHPIGGGLLTTGDTGLKYYPNHELSGFPSDSGFLKAALETGWIGLVLTLLFYGAGIGYGVYVFSTAQNPEMRILLAGYIAACFAVSLANFSQVATKMPIGPLLFCIYALFIQLDRLKSRPNLSL